jgi:asparagine synthetase B (glutamine-hydrolysing)
VASIRARSSHRPRVGGHISTYTIGFDAEEVSETAYAREVASLVGADHHERILLPDEAQELLPSLKARFDEPFADESALPTFLVCEAARADVKVVLTGDGGDEVFRRLPNLPAFRALRPLADLASIHGRRLRALAQAFASS